MVLSLFSFNPFSQCRVTNWTCAWLTSLPFISSLPPPAGIEPATFDSTEEYCNRCSTRDPLIKLWTSNSSDNTGPYPSSEHRLQGIVSERVQKNSSIEQEYRDISSMCTAAQMEILELELRARAIRSLMSAKARDATAKTTAAPSSNSSGGYGQH
ncbi:hypothetical protein HPB51_003103 [Rhipicephalus microplus]|uniref:Uncharacterized protein n=1 Tax=Rhipicephalus microplus TaxID=6941 RepID=A0A9J6EL81_RHIMP|nr:hypothetical protein HPB51_003103 [Rhipicephalus microplus]